ncbi:MAG: Rrf2 family transcriptional regulator [Limosilactobacillus sp.]|uniref:Rrf2 family transcriptional regulator n=1 Tax=Limosilactobacillus sp. TaxID=2773925 RepID=UPI0026FC1F42|nr:Rrf2 family transcriptional regulator [Limosilactobacillus sp.]
MRKSTKFSDSIHILAFLNIYNGKIDLTSDNIASSVQSSPVVVRRLMGSLRNAGLINTTHGSANPVLARPADQINLYDIYLAVEGPDQALFDVDYETAPECIVGGNIQSTLETIYNQAQIATEAKLRANTLQDVIDTILVKQSQKEAQSK